MHNRQGQMRIAQAPEQVAHAFELEILHPIDRRRRPLVVDAAIEKIQGLLIAVGRGESGHTVIHGGGERKLPSLPAPAENVVGA
jgi:hypothetical protein